MQDRRAFLRQTGGLLLLSGLGGAAGIGCGGGSGSSSIPAPTPKPLPYYPPAEFPSNPTRGQEWTNPKDGSVMIWVPGGTFQMGTNIEHELLKLSKPVHTVTLSGFWMAKYEVTYGQFKRYAEEIGLAYDDGDYLKLTYRDNAGNPKDNYPFGGNWDEAMGYANWAGLTLPTEAQWEYAATGGDGRRFPWGNEWDLSRCQVGSNLPTDVGSYANGVSPFGMYDMIGNVWEWCRDWFDDYPSTPQTDPSGPATGTVKVFRGISHSLALGDLDQAKILALCSCSYRYAGTVIDGGSNWGLRLASR